MRNLLLCLIILALLVGCREEGPGAIEPFSDLDGPVLLSAKMTGTRKAVFVFDEYLDPDADLPSCRQAHPAKVLVRDDTLEITFSGPLPIGKPVMLEGRVKDRNGNSCLFTVPLWAYNGNPASLLITECSTKGTKTQPDRVEVTVTREGSLAGLVVADGKPGNRTNHVVLPDVQVWAGEVFVVQMQEGSCEADYRSEELAGLGANNGCVVILSDPSTDAEVVDALLYTSGTSSQAEGWGTEDVRERTGWVAGKGGWTSASCGDAVDGTATTSTRTFSRQGTTDTGTKADWYITPKGGASWGLPNP